MSNKELILPQLDKLGNYHKKELDICAGTSLPRFHEGWIDAIEQFRLMLEGIDVTVDLEVGNDSKDIEHKL